MQERMKCADGRFDTGLCCTKFVELLRYNTSTQKGLIPNQIMQPATCTS